MKQAWILQGGWEGHEPDKTAPRFKKMLEDHGYQATIHQSLDCLADEQEIRKLDLVVACWTMGEIDREYSRNLSRAVGAGVGLAGCHGGMCDAFRESTEWQFMTGGQWVAHPGNDGTPYIVNITNVKHEITAGISDFSVRSEQYYMHVDPAVRVLATTRFPVADGPHVGNGPVDMPVVWTKVYGSGKVFYNSLGHHADVMASEPCLTIMRRGFVWAAK